MSDPREFERDQTLSRNRPIDNRPIDTRSGMVGNSSSGWIVAGVIAVVLLGIAAYSYRGQQTTSLTAPATTVGQSTRTPVPTTPLTTPVAPAPLPQ